MVESNHGVSANFAARSKHLEMGTNRRIGTNRLIDTTNSGAEVIHCEMEVAHPRLGLSSSRER